MKTLKFFGVFSLGSVVGAASLFLVLTVQYQKFAIARHAVLRLVEKMPPLIGALP